MNVHAVIGSAQAKVKLLTFLGWLFQPLVPVARGPNGQLVEVFVVEGECHVVGVLGPERDQGLASCLEPVPQVALGGIQIRQFDGVDPAQVAPHNDVHGGRVKLAFAVTGRVGEGVRADESIVGRVVERAVLIEHDGSTVRADNVVRANQQWIVVRLDVVG